MMRRLVLWGLLASLMLATGAVRSPRLRQRVSSEQYLLAEYPGAAAAYSLRVLSPDFKNAAIIRVRRSSDDAEADFTAAELTDGTLITWAGANDGFVRTWYDQSGNARHATQATAGSQPMLVDGGSLLTVDGSPKIQFDGVDDYLGRSTFITSAPFWVFAAGQIVESQVSMVLTVSDLGTLNNSYSLQGNGITSGNARFVIYTGTFEASTVPTSGTHLTLSASAIHNGTDETGVVYFDGVAGSSITNSTPSSIDVFSIGALRRTTTVYYQGSFQEIITYDSDVGANQSEIISNVKSGNAVP